GRHVRLLRRNEDGHAQAYAGDVEVLLRAARGDGHGPYLHGDVALRSGGWGDQERPAPDLHRAAESAQDAGRARRAEIPQRLAEQDRAELLVHRSKLEARPLDSELDLGEAAVADGAAREAGERPLQERRV